MRKNKLIPFAAVVLSAALLLLSFGCGTQTPQQGGDVEKPKQGGGEKEPDRMPRHQVSELSRIFMRCSHSYINGCYSFELYREGEDWLFDADCFIEMVQEGSNFPEAARFTGRKAAVADVEELYKILEAGGTVAYVENYKKPKKCPFEEEPLDAPSYGFSISFSDGSSYNTETAGEAMQELEGFFYGLAEKLK